MEPLVLSFGIAASFLLALGLTRAILQILLLSRENRPTVSMRDPESYAHAVSPGRRRSRRSVGRLERRMENESRAHVRREGGWLGHRPAPGALWRVGRRSATKPYLPLPGLEQLVIPPLHLSRTWSFNGPSQERQRKPRIGKRSKLPYPSRRCAALIDVRTQCPGNAVEPTDYCAQHQNRHRVPSPRKSKFLREAAPKP